jgi:hypothetical protein
MILAPMNSATIRQSKNEKMSNIDKDQKFPNKSEQPIAPSPSTPSSTAVTTGKTHIH